jgi:hypothetical protein
MTYVQLAIRRPGVLLAELDLAGRELAGDLGALVRLAFWALGLLADRAAFRGWRWDWESRSYLAQHRRHQSRSAPILLGVLAGIALLWGAGSFIYMATVFL